MSNLLLALDPSLTASGWALFSLENGQPLSVGVLSPPGPRLALSKRLSSLQQSVQELYKELRLSEGDYLICEGPAPLVLNPQSALKVEQVRGIFEAVARINGILVPGRVNPRTVQTEVLGMRGKQLVREQVKLWARETAIRLFADVMQQLEADSKKASQDIVDALLIGSLAVSRVLQALQAGVPVEQVFAENTSRKKEAWGKSSAVRWDEKSLKKILNK